MPQPPAPLACTVRNCGEPLARQPRAWSCLRGHSFDIARSGYVNLLQPQDRRSPEAGDRREAVMARARLTARHADAALVESIANRVDGVADGGRPPVVVDLGCGVGHVLEAVAARVPITGVGLDLSVHAIELATKRAPDLCWAVANVDRRLPVLDRRVDLVLSVNARRHPAETARVLRAGGLALVAVPAEDDLIELREAVQGEGIERPRADAVVAEHLSHFRVEERWSVRARETYDAAVLRDLLTSTYRGIRQAAAGRLEGIERLTVTTASDLMLLSVTARPPSRSVQ